MQAGEIFKHALPADAGLGIFTGRIGGQVFGRPAAIHRHERIDAARREGDDARVPEGFRHQGRYMHVHGPGQFFGPLRAELAPGHVNDILGLRQGFEGTAVEQVGLDGFNAPGLQPGFDVRIAEPRHADDAFVRRRVFGETGQGRSHLAADAQHHDIAVNGGQVIDQGLGRRRHEGFKMVFVFKPVWDFHFENLPGCGNDWSVSLCNASVNYSVSLHKCRQQNNHRPYPNGTPKRPGPGLLRRRALYSATTASMVQPSRPSRGRPKSTSA